MKKLILLLFIAQLAFAQAPEQKKREQGERHEFVIANFKTESGVTLPQARMVYGTYGHPNAAKDNVVLVPSHYMADFHGYEWLIGADKALDDSKLYLVATELFGNGNSSSPSNTPEPYHGPRFPVTTIRDNVEAVHRRSTAIDPNISIATVYRTVRLFQEAGILAKHDFGDGRARYEETPDEHHDHLIDIESGRVIEFRNEEIERLQEEIARRLGFRLVDHRLELYAVPKDDKAS